MHRQRGDLIKRPAANPYVPRLAPEAGAAAIRAREVTTIPAQEHADVHLVLLPFEPPEKAANPFVVAVTLDDELPLRVGQLVPGHVETGAGLPGRALEVRELRPVVWLAPRLDGAVIDRFRAVRHHQIHVELDDVAEAVAGGARPERIVEREEPWLRRFVHDPAGTAFEALREFQASWFRARLAGFAVHGLALGEHDRERGPAAFAVRGLDGIREPAPQVALDAQTVDHDFERGTVAQRRGVNLLERHGPAIEQHAAISAAAQRVERLGDLIDDRRFRRLRDRRFDILARHLVDVGGVQFRRHGHDRHLEADHHTRPGW